MSNSFLEQFKNDLKSEEEKMTEAGMLMNPEGVVFNPTSLFSNDKLDKMRNLALGNNTVGSSIGSKPLNEQKQKRQVKTVQNVAKPQTGQGSVLFNEIEKVQSSGFVNNGFNDDHDDRFESAFNNYTKLPVENNRPQAQIPVQKPTQRNQVAQQTNTSSINSDELEFIVQIIKSELKADLANIVKDVVKEQIVKEYLKSNLKSVLREFIKK